MKYLSPAIHGVVDYAAVLIFAAAPTALGLHERAALLSYALALVHLIMTLLTDFPPGVIRIVPLWVHNWVERIVGPALILLALTPVVGNAQPARVFFICMGIVVFIVERLTDYRAIDDRKSTSGR